MKCMNLICMQITVSRVSLGHNIIEIMLVSETVDFVAYDKSN